MFASNFYHLVENNTVYVNGIRYKESRCCGEKIYKISCDKECLYICTEKDPNPYDPISAISVGDVLAVLNKSTPVEHRWKFDILSSEHPHKVMNIVTDLEKVAEMTGLYKSFAVHSLAVDGDTLIIEVRGEINV